jgi:CelD/BcsL family acetyltransferase involved in cellulose biosynthesis
MSGGGITVTVSPLPRLEALEGKWRHLECRADSSFFQTWSWIGTWLGLATFRTPPRLIAASRGGDCVGLAILSACREVRHGMVVSHGLYLNETGDPNYDLITIEHNGVLTDRQGAADIEMACLRWLVENDRSWNELHLPGVPLRYAELATPLGLRPAVRVVEPCPSLDLEGLRTSDDLLAQLSSNTRRQYQQSLRYYRARGEIGLDAAASVTEANDFFAELKRLHVLRWSSLGRPHAFRAPFFERFHAALIAGCVPEQRVELLRVSAGGQAIGYLYQFRHAGRVYNYQCAFEYEPSPHARPGLVSQLMAIGRAIAQGARSYDLLAGSTRFKSSLASRQTRLAWLILQRADFLLRAEGAARALKAWLAARRKS